MVSVRGLVYDVMHSEINWNEKEIGIKNTAYVGGKRLSTIVVGWSRELERQKIGIKWFSLVALFPSSL